MAALFAIAAGAPSVALGHAARPVASGHEGPATPAPRTAQRGTDPNGPLRAARLHSLQHAATTEAYPSGPQSPADPLTATTDGALSPAHRPSPPSERHAQTPPPQQAAAAAPAAGLPRTWCGTPQARDLPDPPGQAGQPVVKVIYAYPTDVAARVDYFADLLQANASLQSLFVAQQSGYRKTPRFDMGSTCGPQYLDLQVVALKRSRVEYLYSDPASPDVRYPYVGQSALYEEVKAATAGQTPATSNYRAPVRNFVIYIQGMNMRLERSPGGAWVKTGRDTDWGAAGTYEDESADPYNQRNVNSEGQIAAMYGADPDVLPQGLPVADPSAGFMPYMALHEIFHTLGAVQKGAPHSTGYLHCTDGQDLMCYRDSSAPSSIQLNLCALLAGLFTQQLDCNKDDYFNPSPPGGTYLATSWNTYGSPFLGSCQELTTACGGQDRSTAADRTRFDTARANAKWRREALGEEEPAPTPTLKLSVRLTSGQRLARQGRAIVAARCDRRCALDARARVTVRLSGRSWPLQTVKQTLAANSRQLVRLKMSPRTLRAFRRAAGRKRAVTVRVSLRARDSSGVAASAARVLRSGGR